MRSELAIHIDAPPQLVFDVVSDPTRWPALLPHYLAVTPLSRRPGPSRPAASGELLARYVAVRRVLPIAGLGFPVAWTSLFRADRDRLELSFRHVAGATRGMAVTWHLEPHGSGTRVRLIHELSRSPAALRWLGEDWYPRFLDRWFVRPIAGRTLATFQALCAALPPSSPEAPPSATHDQEPRTAVTADAP